MRHPYSRLFETSEKLRRAKRMSPNRGLRGASTGESDDSLVPIARLEKLREGEPFLGAGFFSGALPDPGRDAWRRFGGEGSVLLRRRFLPMSAASIASVPAPQNGSRNGRSAFPVAQKTSPAASVSLSGASPDSSRYPVLWSPAPVVSRTSIASSFKRATSTETEARLRRDFEPIDRFQAPTIAFFTMLWQAGTLASTDRTERPRTGNLAFLGRKRSHGTSRAPSKSASKSAAGNDASRRRTRSEARSERLCARWRSRRRRRTANRAEARGFRSRALRARERRRIRVRRWRSRSG